MNAPEKIHDRARFIGGSDAAAIMGLSPHDTRLDLYLYKVGEKVKVFTPQQQKALKRGQREEPRIVDDLIDEYAVKVTKRSTKAEPNRYVDPLEPYLAAEIDFEWEVTPAIAERFELPEELIGTIQNGEVKTVYIFAAAKFGQAETDEIPVEYAAQAMHGLMVANRQICMFAVRDGFNLTVYFIRRDDETIAGMREQEISFWHDNVLARVPPEPVNLPDIFELFKRRLASSVLATPEIAQAVQELAKHRSDERVAKEKQDELKFQIGKFMLGEESIEREQIKRDGQVIEGKVRPTAATKEGVHELHIQGAAILQIVMQNQRRIDTDALREKHPEVAEECVHTVQSLKFQSPKRKKGTK